MAELKQTKPQIAGAVDGPKEPKAIMCIGGPWNCKKRADCGETEVQTQEGDLYRRVRIDARDKAGRLEFDVLGYWGKAWHQGM